MFKTTFKASAAMAGLFILLGSAGQAASIQSAITTCSAGTTFDSFQVTGNWSRDVTGPGSTAPSNICTGGTGTIGGSNTEAFSTARATSVAQDRSVSYQSTIGARNLSTYQFMVMADPGFMGTRIPVTLTARLTGAFDLDANWTGESASAAAVSIIGGSMYVNTIANQTGFEQSYDARATIFPAIKSISDSGTVDETFSVRTFVDLDTLFDVQIASYAWAATGARINFGGLSADADAQTTALVQLTGVTVDDGFCVKGANGAIDTCIDDPDTPPAVPLPAAGWLLAAGFLALSGTRRRR